MKALVQRHGRGGACADFSAALEGMLDEGAAYVAVQGPWMQGEADGWAGCHPGLDELGCVAPCIPAQVWLRFLKMLNPRILGVLSAQC